VSVSEHPSPESRGWVRVENNPNPYRAIGRSKVDDARPRLFSDYHQVVDRWAESRGSVTVGSLTFGEVECLLNALCEVEARWGALNRVETGLRDLLKGAVVD
jgi:hypothetical protein